MSSSVWFFVVFRYFWKNLFCPCVFWRLPSPSSPCTYGCLGSRWLGFSRLSGGSGPWGFGGEAKPSAANGPLILQIPKNVFKDLKNINISEGFIPYPSVFSRPYEGRLFQPVFQPVFHVPQLEKALCQCPRLKRLHLIGEVPEKLDVESFEQTLRVTGLKFGPRSSLT